MRSNVPRNRWILGKKKNGDRQYQFDYFISHAAEDKEAIVLPVTRELDKLGIRFFLDTREIPWGRSLHQNITKGFIHSRYFLAFITETYLNKTWPMMELKAAFHQHVNGREEFILPVLAGTRLQKKRIIDRLPLLSDVMYLAWNDNAAEIAILLDQKLRKKIKGS